MFQVMSFMSDSDSNQVNRILAAATGRRRHAHGPAPSKVRCNYAALAYADDCFGESKIVRHGLAWPMPAHESASNLNSARAQVGMWVISLSK